MVWYGVSKRYVHSESNESSHMKLMKLKYELDCLAAWIYPRSKVEPETGQGSWKQKIDRKKIELVLPDELGERAYEDGTSNIPNRSFTNLARITLSDHMVDHTVSSYFFDQPTYPWIDFDQTSVMVFKK